MCEALRELMKEDLQQAEAKGKLEILIKFVLNGTIKLEVGAQNAKMTVEAFKSLMEEYKATGKVVLN